MFRRKYHIGMDFSSANTRIYVHPQNVVYDEPTLLAIDQSTGRHHVGNEARKQAADNPDISLVNPLFDASFVTLLKYIEHIIDKVALRRRFARKTILLSFSIKLTEEEQEKIKVLCHLKKFTDVIFMDPLYLAVLGNDIDLGGDGRKMIVNIGANIAEVAIYSSNQFIIREGLTVDGYYFSQKIRNYFAYHHKIELTDDEVETIKKEISDLEGKNKDKITFKGIEIETSRINLLIEQGVDLIVEELRKIIEVLTEKTIESINNDGIILIGGIANIRGIDSYLGNKLDMKVRIGSNPTSGIIKGMSKVFRTL